MRLKWEVLSFKPQGFGKGCLVLRQQRRELMEENFRCDRATNASELVIHKIEVSSLNCWQGLQNWIYSLLLLGRGEGIVARGHHQDVIGLNLGGGFY